MTVLVTGCFGFIGYNFLKYLSSNKISYIGIDNLQSDSAKLLYSKENYHEKFHIFDISNQTKLDQIKKLKIDTIINFAAETHVDNSIFNPSSFIKSNILGLTELLTFAVKNEIPNFVHISTDEVYGSSQSKYFKEDDNFKPSSPYSASKAGAELVCNSFSNTYGINIKIVRPSNNYGPYQQPEKLIPFSIANLLNNKNIEIYGMGNHIRHWLHVEDTCSAIFEVWKKGENGEAYNIGSGEYFKNIEVAKEILNAMNLPDTRLEFVDDRPGHDFRYAVNFEKITKLGWKPKNQFLKEIPKIINWYIGNSDLWKEDYYKILEKRSKRLGL